MSNKPNEDELLKQLIGNALGDSDSSVDRMIDSFDRIAIGFLTRFFIESMPPEQSKEVKETLYQRWVEMVEADKPANDIAQSIFGQFFNADIKGNQNQAFNRADSYVKSVLNIPLDDKETNA